MRSVEAEEITFMLLHEPKRLIYRVGKHALLSDRDIETKTRKFSPGMEGEIPPDLLKSYSWDPAIRVWALSWD